MNKTIDINYVKITGDEFIDIVYDDIMWYYKQWWGNLLMKRMSEPYNDHIAYSINFIDCRCITLLKFED